MIRRVAPLAFALALVAFALPFATVSCDDARVEPSGADLVLRTAPETEGRAPEGMELGELVVAYGGGLATAAFLAFALSLLASVRMSRSGWVRPRSPMTPRDSPSWVRVTVTGSSHRCAGWSPEPER